MNQPAETATRSASGVAPPKQDVTLLLVLAGPAGSGKTTLCDRLVSENERLERVVTCTTRGPRQGEVEGVDYFFLSNEQFDQAIATDAFLEWARVHANRYGVLKRSIQEKLDARHDIVMNVDVQGVRNLKQAAEEDPILKQRLVTIFIYPMDLEVVRRRLRSRGKDDEAEIDRRIETAKREVAVWPEFDYVLSTKSKEEDYAALKAIIEAEKRRSSRLL